MKSWVVGCIAACLLLSGCVQAPQAPSKTNKIQLEFWTIQLADFKDTLQPMFDAYEHTHPNIKIKWVDVPGNEAEKRALTAMMSPHLPDVINLNPDFSAVLASRNALMDMNEALTPAQQQAYLPVAWQAASIRLQGKTMTFGLPWYITSRVTLYNKAILQKAGFQHPPTDYQSVIAFAKAVKAKTGQYALMPIITQSGNFLKELKKMEIDLYDATTGRAVFADNPESVTHLNRFLTLYRQGLIPAEALTEEHRAAVDRYQSGTLGMLLVGPNFLKIVQENAPAIYQQTAVAPQFPAGSDYTDFSEMLLVVPKKSSHPKEAVEFALFITNAVNQLKLAQAAPVLPSVKRALEDSYFDDSADLMAHARTISAQQLLHAKTAYQIRPRQNDINEAINYYVQMTLLGKLPPEVALQKAQQKINEILQ